MNICVCSLPWSPVFAGNSKHKITCPNRTMSAFNQRRRRCASVRRLVRASNAPFGRREADFMGQWTPPLPGRLHRWQTRLATVRLLPTRQNGQEQTLPVHSHKRPRRAEQLWCPLPSSWPGSRRTTGLTERAGSGARTSFTQLWEPGPPDRAHGVDTVTALSESVTAPWHMPH